MVFISRASLASDWVREEARIARYRAIRQGITKIVPFIIDDSVQLDNVPGWLLRHHITRSAAAKPLARIVRRAVDEVVRQRQQHLFIGRGNQVGQLEALLAPLDSSPPPKAIGVSGLDGIGRRTLLRRVARDVLGLRGLLELSVSPGDSIQDLTLKVADEVTPVPNVVAGRNLKEEIQNLSTTDTLDRLQQYFLAAKQYQELPVLLDGGALFDEDGRFANPIVDLMESLDGTDRPALAFVSNRRPPRPFGSDGPMVPSVHVPPLRDREMRQLVTLAARGAGIDLTSTATDKLVDALRGYPPAAFMAIELLKAYGPDLATSPASPLVDFRVSPFLEYLRTLAPESRQKEILRILASNSPLPLSILTQVLLIDEEQLGTDLMALIDAALVEPDPSGLYRISNPITEAVVREYRECTQDQFAAVAAELGGYLDALPEDEVSVVELMRVRYRALVMSGSSANASDATALTSDLVQLAERQYHRQNYDECVSAARAALSTDSKVLHARRYLIRGLIKLSERQPALEEIEILRSNGLIREAEFFLGFLERNMGNSREALTHYQQAYGLGWRGVAIDRELAVSYLDQGNLDKAASHIADAYSRQPDNPYVIDLAIKVACIERDESLARDLLERLEPIDDAKYYQHRRSRVEYTFSGIHDALEASRAALRLSGERPPFEILTSAVLFEVLAGLPDEAQGHLEALERMYRYRDPDIRHGLACRLALSEGRYRDALGLTERLRQDKLVHLRLRRDATEGVLANLPLSDEEAHSLEGELVSLKRRLSGRSVDDLQLISGFDG